LCAGNGGASVSEVKPDSGSGEDTGADGDAHCEDGCDAEQYAGAGVQ
jgi:hypothetical protein